MRYKLEELGSEVTLIPLGMLDENHYETIELDCTPWFERFPDGEVSAIFVRADNMPIPVKLERQENVVVWNVEQVHCSVSGFGRIQWRIASGKIFGKSKEVQTCVYGGIDTSGEIPENAPDWVIEVLTKADEILSGDKFDSEGIAHAYEPKGYAIGEWCTHEGRCLRCNTPVAEGEEFDPLKWTFVYITDVLGGGGGGTSDYQFLSNKPSVNGNVLVGNKSLEDLGITAAIQDEVESYVEEHKQDLKGDKGDQGIKGEQGPVGPKGEDGYTPRKGIDYFDGADGAKGEKGDPGEKGEPGIAGEKGEQGPVGPKGDRGEQGLRGPSGADGNDGYTPVKGTDYFTEADKVEMVNAVIAALPTAESEEF